MPTYEYQCKKCAHKFEVFQQITQGSLKSCPVCQGPIQRLIGAGAGIIFKGSGFYATDYRSKAYKEKQKEEAKGTNPQTPCPGSGNNQTCKQCPMKNTDS